MPKQRRHKSRRRDRARFSGLYKVISAALILAAVVAACVLFFRVNEVAVYGSRRYTQQEIVDTSGVKMGSNLFGVNRSRVARTLQARLPYIQSATVRWTLPDTLSITVVEEDVTAALRQDGRWWLIGKDCKLLEDTDIPGDHPVIEGLTPLAPAVGTYLAAGEEQVDRLAALRELLSGLEENRMLSGLEGVDLTEDSFVTFTFRHHFTVRIGAGMEKGMSYWLRRLDQALQNPAVAPNQDYRVEITDGTRVRFIPR